MNRGAPEPAISSETLDSWKAIAAHLQRDVRTVMRWERDRRMPVHRVPGGGKPGVYALKAELDAWWNGREMHLPQAASRPTPPSIAVLPFANLSADKDNEYFSDGLAEDIIEALAKVPGLRVIARTSAFAFRGKNANACEIGASLRVATLLEGAVRQTGSRIRITVQLIQAADHSHLWSERYDRELTDVFAIQDEISQAIADKLRVRLAGDRPLVKRYTDNLEAYNLFLRGRHSIMRATQESLTKGKEYLEQAIALDANYALAYVGIAEYYLIGAFWGLLPGSDALPKAKAAALAALNLDDTLGEAHGHLAAARGTGDFDWLGAEQEFRRALELSPSSPIVHHNYGRHCLRPLGRLEEELEQARWVVELDPLSARYIACLGYLYDIAGQYDLAIAQQRRAMELDPVVFTPHFVLALAYEHAGRFEEAVAPAERACELSGRNPRMLGTLAWVYGQAGRVAEGRALLNDLITQSHKSWVPPYAMMIAYRGLGELDRALEWMEKAVEQRDLMIVCGIRCEPMIALHGNPRHEALLKKMNLDPQQPGRRC